MTVCFSIHSQNTSTITITSDQLRTANLIFAEHKEYSKLIPLLQLENSKLVEINKSWERTDSIKNIQIYQKNKMITEQNIDMNRLQITSKTCGTVAGISILVTVLCLLLK